MLKKYPSEKISVTKNALFFLSRAPTHHSFTFNSQFAQCSSLEKCGAFLLKFVFLLNKKYGLFDFKNVIIPCKIKMIKKTSRPRIFKPQREVWKSSDICMGRSSPKTDDLETKFLNLENQSFEYVTFS